MPSKPKKAPPPAPVPDRVIDAAFALAASQGWSLTGIRDIAAEAGIGLAELYAHFPDRDAILEAYGRRLDRRVLEAFGDINPEVTPRDALFDLLMERFDRARDDRAAILSIVSATRFDPAANIRGMGWLCASMTRLLEAAGLGGASPKAGLRAIGLSAVSLWVTRSWLEDDTEDLSRTMAALDKALARVDGIAGRFNL
jgi:AcrR family transcriptional regulator